MARGGAFAVLLACIALMVVLVVYRMHRGRLAPKKTTLYDRLGGVYAIARVVDRFSEEVLKSPVVGVNSPNAALREWSRKQSAERLPGLKFMRTLWVCDATGGPLVYSGTKPDVLHLGLAHAHRNLRITPTEFDEVARILGTSLDHAKVSAADKAQVLAAFAAHKNEVTAGAREASRNGEA